MAGQDSILRDMILGLVPTEGANIGNHAGWPGVTSVTRRLLEHWHDRDARQHPFYFCPSHE